MNAVADFLRFAPVPAAANVESKLPALKPDVRNVSELEMRIIGGAGDAKGAGEPIRRRRHAAENRLTSVAKYCIMRVPLLSNLSRSLTL